eukprot:194750-Prorocentrum_minimum.AAC.4
MGRRSSPDILKQGGGSSYAAGRITEGRDGSCTPRSSNPSTISRPPHNPLTSAARAPASHLCAGRWRTRSKDFYSLTPGARYSRSYLAIFQNKRAHADVIA